MHSTISSPGSSRLAKTVEGCQDYLMEFESNDGMYLPNVKEKLAKLTEDKQAFEAITKELNIEQKIELCNAYLDKYTEGVYRDDVERIKKEAEKNTKDEKMYAEISKEFTISNCLEYLSQFIKYEDIVKAELSNLQRSKDDRDAYDNITTARETATLNIQELIKRCKDYPIEFKNGKYLKEIDTILDELFSEQTEEEDFEEIKELRTIESVEAFVEKYKEGKKKANAETLLHELKEEKRKESEKIQEDNDNFKTAVSLNTKEAFEKYLVQHPNGLNKEGAEIGIRKFISEAKDRNEFEKASSTNTIEAYEAYMSMFDKPLFAYEAQEKIEQLKRLKKDKEMFEEAERINTTDAYLSYLTEFKKDGNFKSLAIAKMRKAELGDVEDDNQKTTNPIIESENDWLKPNTILQIVTIILLVILILLKK